MAHRTNTDTLQCGAMLALVIDALTDVLYLATRPRGAAGAVADTLLYRAKEAGRNRVFAD